jgi:hypothetical protein
MGSPNLILAGSANLDFAGAANLIRQGAANLILALALGVTLWVTRMARLLGGIGGGVPAERVGPPGAALCGDGGTGDVAPMANQRIAMHRLEELVRLHRLGETTREVARLLGMSPNTERAYREAFVAAGLLEGSADALPPLAELKTAVLAHRPPPGRRKARDKTKEVPR